MSNHDNIYNILGKLSALEPKVETKAPKKNQLNEHMESIQADTVSRLNEKFKNFKTLTESQQIDELSPKTLGSYVKNAAVDAKFRGYNAGAADWGGSEAEKHPSQKTWPGADQDEKAHKRLKGIRTAVNKMVDKSVHEDEEMGDTGYCDACDRPENECMCDGGHDENEYGMEGEHVKSHLHTIMRNAGELEQVLADSEDLPEWVEDKINTARGMLDAAAEYMQSQHEMDHEDETDEEGYHPEMEDASPKADKDYDGDGEIESEKDEVIGSRRKAAGLDEGTELKKQKRAYNQAAKDANADQVGAGKKIDTMKNSLRQKDVNKKVSEGEKVPTKTGYIHKGTYGSDYDVGSDSGDTPAQPKKVGRPSKAKGPERVTSKAWKHKDGRKTNEAIKLDTFVEDTMAEIQSMFLPEKAVSQAQQKFMGMVHAMQKGDKVKGASPELKKTAKSMGKQDAKDFASTKHKGLLKHVAESKLYESINYAELMREQNQSVQEMLEELQSHMEEYRRTGSMHDRLRDALEIHRHAKKLAEREMPHPAPAAGMQEDDHELEHLARLAGVQSEPHCNHSHEGQMCPVHGMSECYSMGGMMEAVVDEDDMEEGNEFSGELAKAQHKDEFEVDGKKYPVKEESKPDYIDIDKDGDKKEPMKKAVKDKELDEAFTAMLKLAGMPGQKATETVAEEYANEPDETYVDTDAIVKGGADLNRPKLQDPHTANKAANPLGEDAMRLESRLQRMYDSIKIKTK